MPARALLAAASAAAVLAAPGAHAATSVEVGDDYFVRPMGTPTVTAKRNARLTFRWVGRNPHQIRVTSGPVRFRSTTKTSGTYRSPRLRRGSYRIVCTIHPFQQMRLKVR